MERRKDDVYVAGMWKESILDDLAFSSRDGIRKDHAVPTWSWISAEGQVQFSTYKKHPTLSLVDLSFTRISPANVGKVVEASITIKGPTFMAKFARLEVAYFYLEALLPRHLLPNIPDERAELVMQAVWGSDINPEKFFTIMMLSTYEGLVSYGILLEEMVAGQFKRVRYVRLALRDKGPPKELNDDVAELIEEKLMNRWLATLPLKELKIF